MTRSSSGENGFGTKSYAPDFMASTAVPIVAKPVMTTMMISGSSSWTRATTSSPLIPGIFRSTTTSDGFRLATPSRPRDPSSNSSTRKPILCRIC